MTSKRWKQLFPILLFVGTVLVLTYFTVGRLRMNGRWPAAISETEISNVSSLEGEALRFAVGQKLIQDMKTEVLKDQIGISFEHFLASNSQGQADFVCNIFDELELKFFAEGMAVDGAPPELVLRGPCEPSSDPKRMKTLWIPSEKIKGQIARNGEFKEGQLSLRFSNMGDSWPEHWVLREIRIHSNEGPELSMIIPKAEVNELSLSQRTVSW